jgi:hypothetical protein
MQRDKKQIKSVGEILVGLVMGLLTPMCLAADANLNMAFTTTNAGGSYGNKHVHVVWITDQSGTFVYTSGSTTTDTKRAVWANSRASSLTRWWSANPTNRAADVVARTGATQTVYSTYNLNWNWRRKNGTELPDGNYRIHFECTNSDSGTPSNYAYFNITKSTTAWRLPAAGSTTTGGYSNVVLTYTPKPSTAPVITNQPATNITYQSATLNGNLTDDGGQAATVKIYWGDNDGGTTAGSWDSVIDLGVKAAGAFSSGITGLTPLQTYYYRCFASNSIGSTWASPTTGFTTVSAQDAEINLVPSELLFQNTAVDGNATLTFDIENRGQLALQINNISLIGPEAEAFILVSPPAVPFSLAGSPGPTYQKQTITVRFSPTSPKEYALSQVAIASNDNDEPVVYVKLRGSAIIDPAVKLENVGGIGSSATAAALYGADKLVLGQGAVLSVLDVSSPASPRLKYSIPVGDIIEDIVVVGDTAYVAAGKMGIAAISLTGPDPLKPAVVYATEGIAHDVDVNGTTLAVADGLGGVRIYDIAASLTLRNVFSTSGPAVAVRISSGRIYVMDEKKGLLIFDAIDTEVLSGLVAGWKLNESEGTIAEDSTNTYDGVLYNMSDSSWVTGRAGNALTFDGVNDYISVSGYKGILGKNSRTCTVWIKTGGSPANMVIMDWGTAAAGQKWLFGIFTTGQLTIYTWAPYIQTNITVTDNQWHHVAAVLADDGTPDVSEIKLYVDGLLQATTVSSAQAINTLAAADVLIGAFDSAGTKGGYFNGLMDDVRIYNRALSSTEIVAVINQSPTKEYPLEFGNSLLLNGNDAYITDHLTGLTIVDVASQPTLRGQMLLGGGVGNAMAVSGNVLYVASDSGLEIVDITNPPAPTSAGLFAPGAPAEDTVLSGDTLYLAQTSTGCTVWDITTPVSPTNLGVFAVQSNGTAIEPAVDLNHVIIGDTSGIKSVHINVPYLSGQTGQLTSAGAVQDVAIMGTTAYLVCGTEGLKKTDISNPASPSEIGSLAISGFAGRVAVEGNLIAVGANANVYKVDSVAMVQQASWQAEGNVLGLTISGGNVFVAQGQAGFQILNGADLSPVGNCQTGGTAYGVAVSGNYAYLACGQDGLKVVDITTQSTPTIIKTIEMPNLATDIVIVGTKACVSDSSAGLTVFDIAVPTVPTLYARGQMPVPGLRVTSAGSRILLAGIRSGVVVLAPKTWSSSLYSDITSDNVVNLGDVNMLAQQWLQGETLLNAFAENLNYFDTTINLGDFAIISRQWLNAN